MKKKIDKINLLVYILIVVGSLIASYPFISQYYYRFEANKEIDAFKEENAKYSKEELERLRSLEEAYNASLHGHLNDEIDNKLKDEGKKLYKNYLNKNEKLGIISIPRIGQELPVYMGTGENVLQKGVGALENSSLPIGGKYTHSVLTAHRGLPEARLFTDLNKMEVKDIFYMKNKYGTLAYQVDNIEVIEPNDYEKISIKDKGDYMTLLTCTPYMINSHRLIVRGKRIPYLDMEDTDLIVNSISYLKIIALVIYLINIFIVGLNIYRKKRLKNYRGGRDE